MQISHDDWTGLLEDLKEKLNSENREKLLFAAINEIRFITQQNFGREGIDRPQPWQVLKKEYADKWKGGDTTPTLTMSNENHLLRNPSLPHLIEMFRTTVTDTQATLTNDSPYADAHQLGYGLPERPYYPVEGDSLTPFAESKIAEVVEKHFQPQE